jgi:hypothetical protein
MDWTYSSSVIVGVSIESAWKTVGKRCAQLSEEGNDTKIETVQSYGGISELRIWRRPKQNGKGRKR